LWAFAIDERRAEEGHGAIPVHRELTDDDIQKIVSAYHSWRGDKGAGEYEDVAGFCKSATLDEIRSHGHVLTPGSYVGAEEVEDDGENAYENDERNFDAR
jgi:type I restriction enzyme M protein